MSGLIRKDIHIPLPAGESQLRPRLPRPALWYSAIASVPSDAPCSACLLISLLVESILSKYNIFFANHLVSSTLLISSDNNTSGHDLSLYPLLRTDSISYPASLSALTAFHTAVLDTPSSSHNSCPDTYPSVFLRTAKTLSFILSASDCDITHDTDNGKHGRSNHRYDTGYLPVRHHSLDSGE